jgi:ubiquinone/menaquinone biosynthesis C-methylase UbiE
MFPEKIILLQKDILKWYEKRYSFYKNPDSIYKSLDRDDKELAELVELLKNKKKRKVLDLGCGDGRYLLLFAKAGFEVTGIDFSRAAIHRAKKLLIIWA